MVTQLILILHMKNIFVFEIFNIYLNENKANICISSKCLIHIVYIYICMLTGMMPMVLSFKLTNFSFFEI